jgi:hypothetical protein
MTRRLTRREAVALSAENGPTGADLVDPPRPRPTAADVLAFDERVPDPWADEAAAMRERIRARA